MKDGMIKLISSASFNDTVDVGMRIVEDPAGKLVKSAATIFGCDYSNLAPDKDHVGIHLVALGDFEHYGANRNGDSFPKQACIKSHDTFVKYGKVFRHHRNKDASSNLGHVVKSAYNEPMGRIELFIHANKDRAEDELHQLSKEGSIPFSMSCKVAFDRCSICQNIRLRAGDESECDHVKLNLGKMAEDGSIVHTYNDEPRFFDISFVRRPADRIAWDLKVAADQAISSVKLASDEGVIIPDAMAIDSTDAQAKYGYIKKMAEYEQLYRRLSEGTAVSGRDRFLYELRKSASALDDITVEELRKSEPATVFAKLAEHGVILDARSFFKYAMGLDLGEVKSYMSAIESRLPTIFSDLLHKEACQGVCNNTRYDVVDTPRSIPATLLSKIASAHTLVGPDMERRVVDATISGREFKIVIDTPVKIALDSGIIDTLAEEYSAYKLAAIKAISERRSSDVDTLLAAATVQNIVR